ncbi:MAG TPA: hypothetical protein VF131_16525 [Blastocatellia bacterium]|nr:hypothetical protein [Blastocatellia bacterium]
MISENKLAADKLNDSENYKVSFFASIKSSPILMGSLIISLIGIILFLVGWINQAPLGLTGEILKGCGIGVAAFGVTSFIQSAILAKSSTDQLQKVRELISSKLDGVLDENKKQLEKIGEILTDIQLEQFAHLKEQLNPQLNKVFLEFISDWIDKVHTAAKRQEIILEGDDVDLFRHFYRRTLQAFPESRFLATSLPSREYFWKENQIINQAITKFIKEGAGAMERIFYWDKEVDAEISDEEADVIEEQVSMGVEVFVVYDSSVYRHLKRYFVTEEKGAIAWEVIAHIREITKVVATSDRNKTDGYKKMYFELKDKASKVQSVDRSLNRLILEKEK